MASVVHSLWTVYGLQHTGKVLQLHRPCRNALLPHRRTSAVEPPIVTLCRMVAVSVNRQSYRTSAKPKDSLYSVRQSVDKVRRSYR